MAEARLLPEETSLPRTSSGPQMAVRSSAERYKLIVMGRSGVGKSAIVMRYIENQVVRDHDPTIEDLHLKQTTIAGVPASLEILDTAGQETYNSLHHKWMQDGHGFIFVFSLVDRQTFDELATFRAKLMDVHEGNPPPSVILANKADLDASTWAVSKEELHGLREQWKNCLEVVYTSAITGQNLASAFEPLCLDVRERELQRKRAAVRERESQALLARRSLEGDQSSCSRCRLAQCVGACVLL